MNKCLSPQSLRRFTDHKPTGKPLTLAADHPAVVEGRSLFTKSAGAGRRTPRAFVSGHNSRKIGARIQKGAWADMPVFTLTLEERKTCPQSCFNWQNCYGNKMPWPVRLQAGPELEAMIASELKRFQASYPKGFVIRLHVLGDFYSVEYVNLWERWLSMFPAMRVFGYTARQDRIGEAIAALAKAQWDRFAIRSSNAVMKDIPSAIVIDRAELAGEAIVCPAQTGASDCCSTCALCWSTKKTIAFLTH